MVNKKLDAGEFFETASKIAKIYGFAPITDISNIGTLKKTKIKNSAKLGESKTNKSDLSSLLRMYIENSLHEENKPFLTFFSNIDSETSQLITKSKAARDGSFTLATVGVADPFAEAIVISCAIEIIKNLNVGDKLELKINSIGDDISAEKYMSEFDHAFKKRIESIPRECIKLFHRDVLDAHKFIQTHYSCEEIRRTMPSTLKYLSDPSKKHFQNVLEYLDEHKIIYSLSQGLIDTHKHCAHTIFEITNEYGDVLASGKRCDSMAKHLFDKEIPSLYMNIKTDKKVLGDYKPKKNRKRHPKIFLVHSCYASRIKVLPIFKSLIDENVPVDHRLYLNKVTDQIEEGDADKFPFVLIVGHQEVLEGVARIRNNRTHVQEIIPIDRLALHLKRLKKLH